MSARDRVGLGWRGELAASILDRFGEIDLLEVIAEDWMHVARSEQRALATLARDRPLVLHGVAMGLASAAPVETKRLDRMARLVDVVNPLAWSEHLAFVRAGGVEIGHLAAAPRSAASVEGSLANIHRATRIVGRAPVLENIATLIDPPASTLDEGTWTRAVIEGSGASMLLDLHNLYANALNFGREPVELLACMPLGCVRMVHISGGRWLHPAGAKARLLDDHVHDVPNPVFALLEELAARVPQPLDVILERDGRYPDFDSLVAQMNLARAALARGRARGGERGVMPTQIYLTPMNADNCAPIAAEGFLRIRATAKISANHE
jgi:uncharacterized protein